MSFWSGWNKFWGETMDPLDWVESPNEKKKREAQENYDVLADQAGDVSMGEPIYDENGRIIGYKKDGEQIADYTGLWDQLDTAKEMGVPDLNSWMDQQGYNFYDPMAKDDTGQFTDQTMRDMQGLIDQLTTGPSAMELDQATAYAEQTMGLDPGTYNEILNGLRQASEQPISEMQGMSEEERAVRERANRNELRNMEERATRMIENIQASSGSIARSYAAADQAISQINDAQIKQDLAIYNDDFQRKMAESDKAMQRYQLAVQNGQMSKSQYLQMLQQNKALAFQGYATQVNTMMQENQQYLQMYQSDMAAIQANIDNIYKSIQMEIGIDEKAMNDIERQYNMEMAPILTQMNIAAQQIEQAESEISTYNIFNFLVDAAAVVAMFIPGGKP